MAEVTSLCKQLSNLFCQIHVCTRSEPFLADSNDDMVSHLHTCGVFLLPIRGSCAAPFMRLDVHKVKGKWVHYLDFSKN